MEKVFSENILESDPDSGLFINRNDIEISKTDDAIENSLKPIRVAIVNKGG